MGKIEKKMKSAKFAVDAEAVEKEAEEIVNKVNATVSAPPKSEPKKPVIAVPVEKKATEPTKQTPEGFTRVAIKEEEESSESEEETEKEQKPKAAATIWSEEEVKRPGEKKVVEVEAKAETAAGPSAEEIDKFFAESTAAKEEGNTKHKSGQYEEAVKKYEEAVAKIAKLKVVPHNVPETEFVQREAVLNSNIAVCYKQLQDTTNAILYSTKVIDSKVPTLLLKALILRAFAYEGIDKLTEAKEDWTRVKKLQPDNVDASKALARIEEAFRRDQSQKVSETLSGILKQLTGCKSAGNDSYKASKETFQP